MKVNENNSSQVSSDVPILLSATEERQANGRYIALAMAILLILLGLYHAWEHRIAVLAGLIIPALIMFLYILWVLYTATKDAKRQRLLQAIREANALHDSMCTAINNNLGSRPDTVSSSLAINPISKSPQIPHKVNPINSLKPSNAKNITLSTINKNSNKASKNDTVAPIPPFAASSHVKSQLPDEPTKSFDVRIDISVDVNKSRETSPKLMSETSSRFGERTLIVRPQKDIVAKKNNERHISFERFHDDAGNEKSNQAPAKVHVKTNSPNNLKPLGRTYSIA